MRCLVWLGNSRVPRAITKALTSKVARGQGFNGRFEPILLTTLRAEPWGLFCQMGIVYKKPRHIINISSQLPFLKCINLEIVLYNPLKSSEFLFVERYF